LKSSFWILFLVSFYEQNEMSQIPKIVSNQSDGNPTMKAKFDELNS